MAIANAICLIIKVQASSSHWSRIAVIFHRIGPYHYARIHALEKFFDTTAIELSAKDDTYAWDKVSGDASFKRVTLFENVDGRNKPRTEISTVVQNALSNCSPDVVVIPGWSYPEAIAPLIWCARNKVPCVIMSESTSWDEKRSALKEMLKRRVVRCCSSALAGGEPHRQYLAELGMPPGRIFLGYDAVDNDYFARAVDKIKRSEPSSFPVSGFRSPVSGLKCQASGLRSQVSSIPAKFFLASARFVEKKNLSRLIHAYARYRELGMVHGPRSTVLWDLVLLGDGPLRPTLKSQLSALNLQDFVHLPGFKQYDELPFYYANASAFVHASTTEQWGLVVNEAMASGLPVLVSNRCGCAQDLVQEGVNGFTFDPFKVEQLAQLMLKISGFNFPLSDFGMASRDIIKNWEPATFAKGMRDAVEVALATPPLQPSLVDRLLLKALLLR